LVRKRTTEQGEFAVAEPFFDDLIAADVVVPDGYGNVSPVGVVIEIDVERMYGTENGSD